MERLSGEIASTKAAAATPGEDMLSDTLMERIRSSKFTPGKSPFQDTPSSSEWAQSPADDNDTAKMDAVRKLMSDRDWKGVYAVSGIFEMEKSR